MAAKSEDWRTESKKFWKRIDNMIDQLYLQRGLEPRDWDAIDAGISSASDHELTPVHNASSRVANLYGQTNSRVSGEEITVATEVDSSNLMVVTEDKKNEALSEDDCDANVYVLAKSEESAEKHIKVVEALPNMEDNELVKEKRHPSSDDTLDDFDSFLGVNKSNGHAFLRESYSSGTCIHNYFDSSIPNYGNKLLLICQKQQAFEQMLKRDNFSSFKICNKMLKYGQFGHPQHLFNSIIKSDVSCFLDPYELRLVGRTVFESDNINMRKLKCVSGDFYISRAVAVVVSDHREEGQLRVPYRLWSIRRPLKHYSAGQAYTIKLLISRHQVEYVRFSAEMVVNKFHDWHDSSPHGYNFKVQDSEVCLDLQHLTLGAEFLVKTIPSSSDPYEWARLANTNSLVYFWCDKIGSLLQHSSEMSLLQHSELQVAGWKFTSTASISWWSNACWCRQAHQTNLSLDPTRNAKVCSSWKCFLFQGNKLLEGTNGLWLDMGLCDINGCIAQVA